MRFALLLSAALAVSACGSDYSATLPDGGRGLVNCDTRHLTVSVKVLDRGGNPAAGASVQANHLSAGQIETQLTGSSGIVTITDSYGPGTVRVKANLNDLNSQQADITFVGTDCSSYATPRSITLQLQ